jgi:hypothetical protein
MQTSPESRMPELGDVDGFRCQYLVAAHTKGVATFCDALGTTTVRAKKASIGEIFTWVCDRHWEPMRVRLEDDGFTITRITKVTVARRRPSDG